MYHQAPKDIKVNYYLLVWDLLHSHFGDNSSAILELTRLPFPVL
jgi:hypothetical protein